MMRDGTTTEYAGPKRMSPNLGQQFRDASRKKNQYMQSVQGHGNMGAMSAMING